MLMRWLKSLFSRDSVRTIESPTLGFLDLHESSRSPYLEEDRAAFGGLFPNVEVSADGIPTCDVLVCYLDITDSGTIGRLGGTVRNLIEASGAEVLIVANPSDADNCITSISGAPARRCANIVFTLDRRGGAFGTFFSKLFSAMFEGSSMPIVWNELAPQDPHAAHDDLPDTIMLCEVGQLTFTSRDSAGQQPAEADQ